MTRALPDALRARLEAAEAGLGAAVEAGAWDARRGTVHRAPKTLVVHGDGAGGPGDHVTEQVLAELHRAGLDPRVEEQIAALGLTLVQVTPRPGVALPDLDAWSHGLLYSQERSSFHAIARTLAERVEAGTWAAASGEGPALLDLCAAPGGKASLLARAIARHGGLLVANEPVPARRGALRETLRRLGAPPTTRISGLHAHEVPDVWHGTFDGVLVDAPCGGEGLLRRVEGEGLSFWTPARVQGCAERQRTIVAMAQRLARRWWVYATCTFSPEENEAVVAHALGAGSGTPRWCLSAPPALERARVGVMGAGLQPPEAALVRRFIPAAGLPGEGLFAAWFSRDAPVSEVPLEAWTRSRPLYEAPERLWGALGSPPAPARPDRGAARASRVRRSDTRRRGRGRQAPAGADKPLGLEALHAASVEAAAPGAGLRVERLEPHLAAVVLARESADVLRRRGDGRVVLWRHQVLLAELPIARGRTRLLVHPAWAEARKRLKRAGA